MYIMDKKNPKFAELETKDWLESLDAVFRNEGPQRVQDLLKQLHTEAQKYGVKIQQGFNTPYINTIPAEQQPPYPGKIEIEHRIKSVIRWNAMGMVVRAN